MARTVVVTASPMPRPVSTVSVNARDALAGVAAESLTETVMLKVPVTVGVPEITPVLAFNANPVGSDPLEIDHV